MKPAIQSSISAAKSRWPLSLVQISQLKSLCKKLGLSAASGDLTLIGEKWYVTHAGLLRLATREGCVGIWARPVEAFCNPDHDSWVFKATVFKSSRCKGFDGYGDACPSNVSDWVQGAEMRIAETRAVNRALRKAYGIGLCSVEERGAVATAQAQSVPVLVRSQGAPGASSSPVRDRLLELIHRHQLDPKLVQSYAADFCGISDVRRADREAVARFAENLATWATRDRRGLVAHLERYGQEKKEAQ